MSTPVSDEPQHTNPRDELVEHLPAMRAFAISLTRNGSVADDMVQDTLVKAWTNIEKFQVGTNMRAWLFTILRNTYYSSRRKAKREVADVDGIFTESLAEKPAHDGHLQMNDFRVALGKLKVEQREALLLIGASGFSYEEAFYLAVDFIEERPLDITEGATHYHRIDVDPSWNKKMLTITTIGDHIFYVDPYRY